MRDRPAATFWRALLGEFVGADVPLELEAADVLEAAPDDVVAAEPFDAAPGMPKPTTPLGSVPTGPGGAVAEAPTPESTPTVGWPGVLALAATATTASQEPGPESGALMELVVGDEMCAVSETVAEYIPNHSDVAVWRRRQLGTVEVDGCRRVRQGCAT